MLLISIVGKRQSTSSRKTAHAARAPKHSENAEEKRLIPAALQDVLPHMKAKSSGEIEEEQSALTQVSPPHTRHADSRSASTIINEPLYSEICPRCIAFRACPLSRYLYRLNNVKQAILSNGNLCRTAQRFVLYWSSKKCHL